MITNLVVFRRLVILMTGFAVAFLTCYFTVINFGHVEKALWIATLILGSLSFVIFAGEHGYPIDELKNRINGVAFTIVCFIALVTSVLFAHLELSIFLAIGSTGLLAIDVRDLSRDYKLSFWKVFLYLLGSCALMTIGVYTSLRNPSSGVIFFLVGLLIPIIIMYDDLLRQVKRKKSFFAKKERTKLKITNESLATN